ncbi:glycosyltransferase [Cyanobacterium aponinum]|uniref:Glycosyl transferase group 1 n=1 Tax=Cyanobacterium aponinum (strain PCC 10605) TaxID=755178 RepID=K9Z0S7_CYAAP|nr:glycosyltransferase [Cyanobacterium aponinum]AFZ52759.1 glycosyl transferase group 1 [Cyanobacterium aponinum PCC 10605]
MSNTQKVDNISVNNNLTNKKRAIFTICSNNYLPYARILFHSLQKYHPSDQIYLCLADKKDPLFPLEINNVNIIEGEELNIPNFHDFAFRYDIMEFNTALKPFMMQLLIEKYNFDQVVYLDPDIELYAPLDSIFSALDNGSDFVITPHITKPSEGEGYPGDIGVMQAGIYNLGFIAVSNSCQVIEFLHWWGRKLRFHCLSEQEKGIFVDQKFVDLLPAFHDKVTILKDTNVNVAYWNLEQRKLEKKNNNWFVDNHPLVFFHYSGIDVKNNQRLSKYTHTFNGNLSPEIQELVDNYILKLKHYSFANKFKPKYFYSYFNNGSFITSIFRKFYRKLNDFWCDNPFENFAEYLNDFNNPLNNNHHIFVTNLMYFLWEFRDDLKLAFDLNTDQGRVRYIQWFIENAEINQFDDYFIEPIINILQQQLSHYKSTPQEIIKSKSPINIIGYLKTETGVGQAARMVIKSFDAVTFPVKGFHVDNNYTRQQDQQVNQFLVNQINSPIHIYKVNADQLEIVKNQVKQKSNKPIFTINMPAWELSRFPTEWVKNYDDIDEVWVESKFVQFSLQSQLNIPVICMPPAVTISEFTKVDRGLFNLPKDCFLFHFNFDFASFSTRKNPQAVIDAYRLAFRNKKLDIPTALVIKTRGYDPDQKNYQKLLKMIDGEDDIIVINDCLSHSEVIALMDCCDCYVSLHCSEGFGYTMAEAMLLKKPVIATNYSGNCDFINSSTGFPVDYQLVSLNANDYPFAQGQKWAKADIYHASWLMQKVVENLSETEKIARAGQLKIQTDYSPISAGKRYLHRLQTLGLIK